MKNYIKTIIDAFNKITGKDRETKPIFRSLPPNDSPITDFGDRSIGGPLFCLATPMFKKTGTGDKMRKKIWARIVPLKKSNDDWDIKFWQSAGVKARFSAAWQMIDEFYKMRGKNGIKRRLQRTVQNIQRI